MRKINFLFKVVLLLSIVFNSACGNDDNVIAPTDVSSYKGTAAVSKGIGTTLTANLYPKGGRQAGIGEITASDNSKWTVPAQVNYTNTSFPFAPDLYNPDGTQHASAAAALAAFNANDIVKIDAGGSIVTGYFFADNYFELYVNGTPVGKDAIPFTQFNSHIVQFRVSKPFTIAMKVVDWEESLGIGTESSGGSAHHPGDGGLVAVFKDANGATIATTGSEWKAQTFYTAPIRDLSCPTENGTTRISSGCDTSDASDASNFYALHWKVPDNWMNEGYDDSAWPNATTYSNTTIGVNNKKAYTNFTDVFDDSDNDAEFIWSTNVILDNEVIVRYTVQ